MKARKHIMVAVVLMVLFGSVSSSLARQRKHGYRGKNYVRNSYSRKSYQHDYYGRRFSHRDYYGRGDYYRRYGRNSIAISVPNFQMVFESPRTRVVTRYHRVSKPAEITVWITNDNGSLTSVTLTRRFSGYVGPLGEYYQTMPTEQQLKIPYGLKGKNTSQMCPRTDY